MGSAIDSTIKFDAFAEEHEQLEQSLAELRELLARRNDAPAAKAALAELTKHIKSHFQHEEQEDGFFENVVDQAPRLQPQAKALIREHATMAEALAEMQSLVDNNGPTEKWWRDLNAHFEAFWELLCRHERAEIDLVQEAFTDDIGAAD